MESPKDWFEENKKIVEEIFRGYGKIILITVLLFVSLLLISEIYFLINPQKLRVSFLDVGQGDAILIQTPSGKSMLVDGGPNNLINEKLASEMSSFDNDIDVMVETHPDADHVTGLIPVLEKYKVKKIILSYAKSETKIFDDLNKHIEEEKADEYVAQSGDSIDFHDGVIAKILYPPLNYVAKKNDTNDASVGMVVIYGDESFLLTGDLPTQEESKLITSGLNKNITVYKAGHHGSKYSSGELLLAYIKPEYSIISAGRDNKYGHPNIETLDRLQKYTKEILSTADRGTISFVANGRTLEVETER